MNSLLNDNNLDDTVNNNNTGLGMGNRSVTTSSNITTAAQCTSSAIATGTNINFAVGEEIDIIEYARQEWHGNTQNAKNIRMVSYYNLVYML